MTTSFSLLDPLSVAASDLVRQILNTENLISAEQRDFVIETLTARESFLSRSANDPCTAASSVTAISNLAPHPNIPRLQTCALAQQELGNVPEANSSTPRDVNFHSFFQCISHQLSPRRPRGRLRTPPQIRIATPVPAMFRNTPDHAVPLESCSANSDQFEPQDSTEIPALNSALNICASEPSPYNRSSEGPQKVTTQSKTPKVKGIELVAMHEVVLSIVPNISNALEVTPKLMRPYNDDRTNPKVNGYETGLNVEMAPSIVTTAVSTEIVRQQIDYFITPKVNGVQTVIKPAKIQLRDDSPITGFLEVFCQQQLHNLSTPKVNGVGTVLNCALKVLPSLLPITVDSEDILRRRQQIRISSTLKVNGVAQISKHAEEVPDPSFQSCFDSSNTFDVVADCLVSSSLLAAKIRCYVIRWHAATQRCRGRMNLLQQAGSNTGPARSVMTSGLCHDNDASGHCTLAKTLVKLTIFLVAGLIQIDLIRLFNALQWCGPDAMPKSHCDNRFQYDADESAEERHTKHLRSKASSRPWSFSYSDFATRHSKLIDYIFNEVVVSTDRFARKFRFTPCYEKSLIDHTALFCWTPFFKEVGEWILDNSTYTRLYTLHIFSLTRALSITGLHRAIVSERDPKRTSPFWTTLQVILGTKLKFSTAHNAQTDGLAERQIGTLEEAIRTYCGFGRIVDRQGVSIDWVTLLPQLEFAYNSSVNATTKQVPFMLAYGFIPNAPMDLIKSAVGITDDSNQAAYAKDWTETIQRARDRANTVIQHAFDVAKKRYDSHHREVDFRKVQRAYLSTKYFNFKETKDKMKPRFIGPYDIVSVKGTNAVELKLDHPHTRRHPVFPVSLLKPEYISEHTFPDHRQEFVRPPPVDEPEFDENQADYEVSEIIDERPFTTTHKGKRVQSTEYLVRWLGYPPSETDWIPAKHLHADRLLREFRATKRKELDAPLQGLDEEDLPVSPAALRRSSRANKLSL